MPSTLTEENLLNSQLDMKIIFNIISLYWYEDIELDYQEELSGFCLKRPSSIVDAVASGEEKVVFSEDS